jgi:tetratricopeptide (TPR) repeat protein
VQCLKGAWAAAVLAASVLLAPPTRAADAPGQPLPARVATALRLLASGTCDGPAWNAISADPDLDKLPSNIRASAYSAMAKCVGGPRAHDWVRRATAEPNAPSFAWVERLDVGVRNGDTEDALASLEVMAARAKAAIEPFPSLDLRWIAALDGRLKNDPTRQQRFLAALDDGGWAPARPGEDASFLWRDYAGLLVDQQRITDAQRVTRKIHRPEALLLLRLDKKFDAVTSASPADFDVPNAAAGALQHNQLAYADATDQVGAYEIINSLRLLGRLDEALSFADATLAKPEIRDARGHDYRNWIEDRRAYVLYDMGRFDEAIAAERSAAGHKENQAVNVSNAINLAGMLNAVGRHAEALTVLPALDGPVSGYGAMWVAAERACAANAISNAAETQKALAFTAAHAADNRNARVKALLCVNDVAAAAKVYVLWLRDPQDHAMALLQLCHFAPSARAPFDTIVGDRFEQIRKDPEVQAEVGKVGRTETLALHGAAWIDFQ